MESLPEDLYLVIWRISNYADLSGRGGLIVDGRWHSRGRAVVYLADAPETALREILQYFPLGPTLLPDAYMLLKIRAPRRLEVEDVQVDLLPIGWNVRGPDGQRHCRPVGDEWHASLRTALLRAPSVACPGGWVFVLNPVHPDSRRVDIVEVFRQPLPAWAFNPETGPARLSRR